MERESAFANGMGGVLGRVFAFALGWIEVGVES